MYDGLTESILMQRDNIENQSSRELNSNREHYIKQLEEENQELKKLLEKAGQSNVVNHKYASKCEDKVITMEAQQKEFIKYLEDEKERILTTDIYDSFKKAAIVTLQHVLSKYKEIIGSDKE